MINRAIREIERRIDDAVENLSLVSNAAHEVQEYGNQLTKQAQSLPVVPVGMDQFQTRTAAADCLYITGVDVTITAQSIDPTKNFYASARRLTIDSSQLRSHHNIALVADELILHGDTVIDVSGVAGAAGQHGINGGDGTPGAHVQIVALTISNGRLTVKATGGDGGAGQDGSDGRFGNPGSGPGVAGSPGSDGTNGGRGGNAGASGTIAIKTMTPAAALMVSNAAHGGRGGQGGRGGSGGAGGPRKMGIRSWDSCSFWRCKTKSEPYEEIAAGQPGRNGASGSAGPNGANSPAAACTLTTLACATEASSHFDAAAATALQYGEYLLLNNQTESYIEQLAWVMLVSPREAHRLRAGTLLSRIQQGQDLYGNRVGLAPLTSVVSTSKEFELALDIVKTAKGLLAQLTASDITRSETLRVATSSASGVTKALSVLDSQRQELEAVAKKERQELAALSTEVVAVQAAASAAASAASQKAAEQEAERIRQQSPSRKTFFGKLLTQALPSLLVGGFTALSLPSATLGATISQTLETLGTRFRTAVDTKINDFANIFERIGNVPKDLQAVFDRPADSFAAQQQRAEGIIQTSVESIIADAKTLGESFDPSKHIRSIAKLEPRDMAAVASVVSDVNDPQLSATMQQLQSVVQRYVQTEQRIESIKQGYADNLEMARNIDALLAPAKSEMALNQPDRAVQYSMVVLQEICNVGVRMAVHALYNKIKSMQYEAGSLDAFEGGIYPTQEICVVFKL